MLGRLTAEPHALAGVARKALELMHYGNVDAALAAADPALLVEDTDAHCVKGCYRCLLSYYNQPDHELIDRTDADVLRTLLRLARSEVAPLSRKADAAVDGDWREALSRWGLPVPDGDPLQVGGAVLPLAWRAHLTAAAIGRLESETRAEAEALGYAVATLPEAPGEMPPPELVELLGGAA